MRQELYNLIADKIERDPSLLRIPLDNIERWLPEDRPAPHRLKQLVPSFSTHDNPRKE